jgi:hypothetical protein
MFFPKVLLNLQNPTISLPRFPIYKIVSYEYPIFKYLLEKLFQIFYQALKDSFRKYNFEMLFCVCSNLCKLTCIENVYKMIYIKEGMHYQQGVWKWISKDHKVFSLISKNYFGNPKLYFALCKWSSFAKIHKVLWKIMFYSENLFLTVLYCLFEF